jgi:hypothetical protein
MQMKHDIDIQGKEVRCEVISSDILSNQDKKKLKLLLANELGEEVHILVSFWYEL